MSKLSNAILELQSLQGKEKELLAAIEAINKTFEDLGIPINTIAPEVDTNSKLHSEDIKRSGICINGKLSFRGHDKSLEYFRLVDLDKDSGLTYTDLRAMGGFNNPFGLVSDIRYQSSDSWNMSMRCDGFVPSDGKLNRSTFIKFREFIEPQQPLAREVQLLKMGLLPSYLQRWAQYKNLIAETVSFRQFKANLGPADVEAMQKWLSLDEFQYVLNILGSTFTKGELALLMYWRQMKSNCLSQLIRIYSKRNVSQAEYPFDLDGFQQLLLKYDTETEAVIKGSNITEIPIQGALPWLVACESIIPDGQNSIYCRLIRLKVNTYEIIRRVDSFCRFLFSFAGHVNDRLLFREFPQMIRMPQSLQQISTYKVGLGVGPEGSGDVAGLGANWKLIRVDNLEAYLKHIGAPAGVGTVISIDLMLHEHMSKSEQEEFVLLLRPWLIQHLEREMKNNASFQSLQVLLSKSDLDEPVLRLLISYKRVVNIDRFLEHQLLQFKLMELVTACVGDIRTNLDLHDLIHNKAIVLNNHFRCSINCTFSVRKNLLASLLERLGLATAAGITREQAEFLNSDSSDKRDERGPAGESKDNKTATGGKVETKDDVNARLLRWSVIFPEYSNISRFCMSAYQFLRGCQLCTYRLHYSSLLDMFRSFVTQFGFSWWGTGVEQVLTTTGFVKEAYESLLQQMQEEFGALFHDLRAFLEKRRADAEAQRRKELMTFVPTAQGGEDGSAPEDAGKAATLSRMKRLGLDAEGMLDNEDLHPSQLIASFERDQRGQDVINLRVLENVKKFLAGLHTMEVISGHSKMSFLFHSADFFELLPELAAGSMDKVVRETQIKKSKA